MISKKHLANFCKVDVRYLDPTRYYQCFSYKKTQNRLVYHTQVIMNKWVIKSELIRELYF